MYKAFSLIGVTAALFVSQGCGGKKEVASAPAPAASPASPAGGSAEQSNDQGSSSGMGAGAMTTMPLPGGSSGGNSGEVNSGGVNSGSMDSGGGNADGGGETQNSGGGLGAGAGMPPKGASAGMPPKGGNRNSGNQVGGQENQSSPVQNNQARNNFARTEKVAPPPTLKEQAVYAFQSGNPKRAYTLLQSHAMTLSDEEAAEILQHYRWSAHKKRIQLGLNVAVGVTVKNPKNVTDLSPIGTQGAANGGGSSSGGMGMMGKPSGGSSGGFGANANSSKPKTLEETTGAFGTELVAAFKRKHESGAWSTVFSEYSLGVPSNSSGQPGGAFAGNSFGGGQSGFSSAPGGDSEPMAGGLPGGAPMNSGASMNSGMSGGMPANSAPGGDSGGMMNSGGGMPNSGGMGAGVPKGSSGGNGGGAEVNSGGMVNSGSLQFQGKGGMGMGLQGPGAPGMAGPGAPPNEPGMSAPGLAGPGVPGMAGPGNPGMGMGVAGPDEPGAGMAGPGMAGPGMFGNGNTFGNGMANRGTSNPGPFAVGRLPAGSSPLAPCLTFIGVDETSKLMKKAVQEGYDGLMLFEVTVGMNNFMQKVTNDTLIRVVQPSLVPKDVKRVYVSTSINNIQFAKAQAKGDADGLEDIVEKTVKMTKDGLALQPIPAGLTPELIATKRIPSLASDTETSVIDRLSEVNFYYYKGFIDENQKADAFEQIASQDGRSLAMGTEAEKKIAIEKLLERDLK